MKSPAVVNYGAVPGSVELRDVETPEIGADEVLLNVAAVCVCGSDLHQWQATHSWPVHYPVVLGHEFSGTVARLGAGVQGFSEGDRVVSETHAIIDAESPLSRRGLYQLDPARRGFGYGVDGAMTRFAKVPARCLHRVPDNLPLERAAFAEPCSVAYNAVVHHGAVQPGDRVVVLGPGPIGLLCGMIARLQGAEVAVAGLPRDAQRLAIAREAGLSTVEGDPEEWARARDGLGADGVIDAAGASAALQTALRIVRPAGWITKVGWGPEPLGFSLDSLVQKDVTLRGSFSHHWPVWERVLALLASGQLDVGPLVGGTWPLQEWRTAFEAMHGGHIAKAVLKP